MLERLTTIPVSVLLFLLVVPCVILYYALYLFNPSNAGTLGLYLIQIAADGITMIIAGSLWLTMLLDVLQPEHHKRHSQKDENWLQENPVTVDVFVPVANEPLEIIKKTLIAARDLEYPHKTICLDDGSSDATQSLCAELGINYLRRPAHEKKYAKAGNINYGLKLSHGEFFAIFDADFVPKKDFLTTLLPFFHNQKLALVQTPQSYGNKNKFIAQGASATQDIFYTYVMPAKNSYNSAFCVGTNMIFRRQAIDEIGGVAKLNHSEDIWSTILLHERGYETLFYNKILAIGNAPDTVMAYFRQQNRWAQGGFSLLLTKNPLFSEGLSLDQKIQYFISNIFYFSGFSIAVYLIMPLIYLLFGYHPMRLGDGINWAIHYLPFFIVLYTAPIILSGRPNVATLSVSLANFWPYIQAFFQTIFQTKFTWVATGSKKNSKKIIIPFIWPHVLIASLSAFSCIIGWYNTKDIATTAATMVWVAINAYFLFIFIRHAVQES